MRKIAYFIKRRWVILIVFIIIQYMPICCAIKLKRIFYKAEAKIAFMGNDGFFNPEVEARKIKEADFLRKVSERVPGLDIPTLRDNLELAFLKTNVLSVSFISASPELARDVVDKASTLFLNEREDIIESLAEGKRGKLGELENQIGILRYNLNSSKRKLRELRQKNSESDKRRVDLQMWLSGLELQRAELLKIFTDKHPEVVNINYRIESIQSQLDKLPDNTPVYNQLTGEIEEWELSLSLKQEEHENLSDSFESKGEAWRAELIEKAALPSRPIGKTRDWYYKWGLLGALVISLICSITIEIVDTRIHTAREAQQYLNLPTVAEIDRVICEKKSRFKGLGSGEKALSSYKNTPRLSRRYEQLYTYLKLDVFRGSIDKKVILITSAEPETGKTFIACNLALAAAKNGEKVLLVDANFRHPSIHHFFGFEDEARGISDVLRGSLDYKDVVKNLTDLLLTGDLELDEEELRGFDNLRILLSGTKVDTPLRLLEAKELSTLFRQLCQNYGFLIIDTSALRSYGDTFNILTSVDALLLVVRKAKTTYPSIRNVVSRINKINAPLTGLVFSDV